MKPFALVSLLAVISTLTLFLSLPCSCSKSDKKTTLPPSIAERFFRNALKKAGGAQGVTHEGAPEGDYYDAGAMAEKTKAQEPKKTTKAPAGRAAAPLKGSKGPITGKRANKHELEKKLFGGGVKLKFEEK